MFLAESWHYAFGVSQEAILGKEGDLPETVLNGVPYFTFWSSQKRDLWSVGACMMAANMDTI